MRPKGPLSWTQSGGGLPKPLADGDLRSLRQEEVVVHFQPIVDLATGRIFAHEALVRCTRPEFRAPPKLFETALEQGMCGRIGRMIREAAVQGCPGVPLFLNVHPEELVQRWLVRPDDPMLFHDAEVFLELTESVPFSHYDVCHTVLRELRTRVGVHLVIDDLGAGYSNLKRIADLHPKVVKLDIELVRAIDASERQQRLVRGVIDLCHDLGALVVAEGIETKGELDTVIELGADHGQGYFLARPAFPAPEVAAGLFKTGREHRRGAP